MPAPSAPRDSPRPPDPPPGPPPTTWGALGELGSVGLSFVMALVMGVGGGWWVDQRFGTAPWGFFVGFAMGFAAGVLNVYRITSRAMRSARQGRR